jgi:uncharacterized protein YggE
VRLAGLIAATLALVAPAALAQPPATPTLAQGEVLLEIDAIGTARSRPDVIRLLATAVSHAETAARARSLNEVLVERLKSAVRSSGAADAEVQRPGSSARVGFVGNETPGWSVYAPGAQPAGKTHSAILEIRLRDATQIEDVRAILEDAGAEQVVGPMYALRDDSGARRLARADAVRQARSQAEDYARSLGLRISRILRVSERPGPYADPADMETMMAAVYGISDASPDEIETKVRIAVDFALAPAP